MLEEIAALRDDIGQTLTAITQAGEVLNEAARHVREQRTASVYDYLRSKLRGVWIRALIITFILWGGIAALGWYVRVNLWP